MRCEEFERNLNEVLDRRENPETDDSLLSHAVKCSGCDELLHGHMALLQSFSASTRPVVPSGFASQIVESMAPSTKPKSTVTEKLLTVAVIAATVLLVVSLIQNNSDEPAVAKKQVKKTRKVEPVQPKKRDTINQSHVAFVGRASVSEALISPIVFHIWKNRSEYNQWFSKTLNSMRKRKGSPKKPRADLFRRDHLYT